MSQTRLGDGFVADRATRPDILFGGEPSGAWIWPTETLCPDGPLTACKLVGPVADRGPLSALVADVETYPIHRRSVEVTEKAAVIDRVRERVCDRYTDISTIDSVYADVGDGWILLRASGTEPVVRIRAEARAPSRVNQLIDDAVAILEDAIVATA